MVSSVSGDNYVCCRHTCVCDQNLRDLNSCKVQQTKPVIDKDDKCTGMEQNHAARKLNPKNTMEDYNNSSLTRLLLHKQPIKICHQNISILRYEMNGLLCHLNHDPPHILCISEHHLHHEKLTSFHIENYGVGSCYCRKSKHKGGVCIFVHSSRKFTLLDINNFCLDQDFEACAIHLNSNHDKLCILTTYRSPQGNFNTFLTKFDLTLNKFYNNYFNYYMWRHKC